MCFWDIKLKYPLHVNTTIWCGLYLTNQVYTLSRKIIQLQSETHHPYRPLIMSESEDCNHTVIQEEHAMVVHRHRRYGKGSPTHLTLLVRSYPHNALITTVLIISLRFRYSDEKVQDITAHNKEFLNNHAPYQLLL